MATIFISYSTDDLVTARTIHAAIAAVGFSCWRDEKWLGPGDDFAVEITKAIRKCDAFVLLLSLASNSSDYVCKEVAIAHHFRKPIIPVLLEKIDLGDRLLPYVIRLHFWYFTEHGASELAGWLVERFGSNTGPATRLFSRAGDQQSEIVSPKKTLSRARPINLISNVEYLAFVQSSRRQGPPHWSPLNPRFSDGEREASVTRVSWDDAVEYCDWFNGCLPSANNAVRTVGPGAALSDAPVIGEWRDAGTERHKQVLDPYSSRLIAVMDREARLPNVGFRCVPVESGSLTKRIYIDGGHYQLGTDIARLNQLASTHRLPVALRQPILNRPVRPYDVPSFTISATCVTNEEFYAFTRATGRSWPGNWHTRWLNRSKRPFPARLAIRPVVNLSAENAQAYCIWSRTRLPSWLEWERAASGPGRQPYSWGIDYSAARCNSVESERGSIAAVDEYSSGDSPEGVRQLCGNVAEWVVGPEGRFEIRGGSYRTSCELWGLAYAFRKAELGFHAQDVGFRVVFD